MGLKTSMPSLKKNWPSKDDCRLLGDCRPESCCQANQSVILSTDRHTTNDFNLIGRTTEFNKNRFFFATLLFPVHWVSWDVTEWDQPYDPSTMMIGTFQFLTDYITVFFAAPVYNLSDNRIDNDQISQICLIQASHFWHSWMIHYMPWILITDSWVDLDDSSFSQSLERKSLQLTVTYQISVNKYMYAWLPLSWPSRHPPPPGHIAK